MDSFAFILHPLIAKDIAGKFPMARKIPDVWLEKILQYLPPFRVSHIEGIASRFKEIEGWFVACPLTAKQMVSLPETEVIEKIIKTGEIAQNLGAKMIGLGAFTSVVGDGGITIAEHLQVPVTTGNSYTVAMALEGTKLAAKLMEVDFKQANILILGATGSIGAACAKILAREVKFLTLAARKKEKLLQLSEQILHETGLAVVVSDCVERVIKDADIILTVTSAVDSLLCAEDLKPGAIVCDVARPRDISDEVAAKRNDILVIEGGVVEVPGTPNFHFNFGFPDKMAYACMAETMILALEGRYESFTLGKNLTVKQIDIIENLAHKHDFKLAGLRSLGRALTLDKIESIKRNAMNKKCGKMCVGLI